MSTTGRVIRFDEFKGYGFVAPDEGGEDVFIHVNDLDFDKRLLAPGVRVRYEVEEGDRGLKASHVQIIDGPEPAPPASTALVTRHRPEVPFDPTARTHEQPQGDEALCDVLSEAEFATELTEALLTANATLSAQQILDVRAAVVQLAAGHSWLEN